MNEVFTDEVATWAAVAKLNIGPAVRRATWAAADGPIWIAVSACTSYSGANAIGIALENAIENAVWR